jgi:hypothetical protein
MTEIICIFSILLSVAAEPPVVSVVEPNALPSAQYISSLATEAKQTYEGFVRDSFSLRLEYEFAGKFFSDEHRSKLQQLARQASEKIAAIETKQIKIKRQIEDYQGSDWERKFGSSGLWRELTADVYFTTVCNCQIAFYLAIVQTDKKMRVEILKTALDRIEVLQQTGSRSAVEGLFLKAKVLGTLAADDLLYRPLARKEFESAIGPEKTGEKDCSDFQFIFEKIKLLGQTEQGQIDSLARQFSASPCKDDLELILSLAGLQYRLGKKEAFEETVRKNPQTQDIIGSFLLAGFLSRNGNEKFFENTTVFEAELAAQRVLKEGAEKYSAFLPKLADEFQTPMVFYVAAQAFVYSEPNKAVDFLIQSSILQNRRKSEWLEVDAKTLAAQTAKFALDLLGKNVIDCKSAIRACENYRSIAAGDTEPKLDYLYAGALFNCNQSEKGDKILQDLAERGAGFWQARAKLDLIERKIKAAKIQKNTAADSAIYGIAISELNGFISEYSAPENWAKQLCSEATILYCQALFEASDKPSLEKIVDIVDVNKINYEPNLSAYKSAALQKLGRIDEAARSLVEAFRPGHCEYAPQAINLLAEAVGKIDYLKEQSTDFSATAGIFEKLAVECCNCPDLADGRQAKLLRAEFAVFAANRDNRKLNEVELLLAGIEPDQAVADADLLRCRARLFAEQGKFQQAAQLWSQICKTEEIDSSASKQKSERWWRAKFYELYCWSQIKQTNKNDVVHSIDVLEKTYTDKPAFWAEKLKLLKQQCGRTGQD